MSVFNLLKLNSFVDERGSLTVIDKDLPFKVERIFWIKGTDNQARGGHRHHVTRQALVAVSGCINVLMDDGVNCEVIRLDSSNECLIVEPKDWHTMSFENDSILLVMASHEYIQSDYIYERYL